MSEYWKSTPKYWCKHCKTFVKDTKFEKTNHEATPKHQGNLKRFLRDLHKGHEREEREKQRAKEEVLRLNGVPREDPRNSTSVSSGVRSNNVRQATPADRKAQLSQLAELGIAVPDDFRKEMAMVGDWQTTSQTPIYERVKEEQSYGDVKPEVSNIGVRKRKFEEQEGEEAAGETVVRRRWGSTTRTYPGNGIDGEDDLDALLSTTNKIIKSDPGNFMEQESSDEKLDNRDDRNPSENAGILSIKREESSISGVSDAIPEEGIAAKATSIKQEDEASEPNIMFKKRKAKPIRQK